MNVTLLPNMIRIHDMRCPTCGTTDGTSWWAVDREEGTVMCGQDGTVLLRVNTDVFAEA